MLSFAFILFIIFLALLFDFLNGMNDAANSIATVVSTKVLSPRLAVVWAALFNFLAAFFFGVHVAATIGKGIIDPASVSSLVIFCSLIGAIIWTWSCTRLGMPISVSHALIGGFIGSAVTKSGMGVLIIPGIIKVITFIFLSPILGFTIGVVIMNLTYTFFRGFSPSRVDFLFKSLQLLSAAAFSLSHGSNDAQKTMGIIAVLLFSTGHLGPTFYIPIWCILACHFVIALGTLFGGWAVVNTVGSRVTKLKPVNGFCAETAGALTILGASFAGIPVSTTHTITGSIMGVGAIKRTSAVRWGVAGSILWAWVLTIPCSAAISAISYFLIVSFR
ncbi:MAG: inorganic phosphate transporter [bacterium]